MAITAIQTQARSMVLMAEGDGLLRRNVLPGNIGRALQLHKRGAYRGKQKHGAKNAGAGQGICTAVKDLCH